MGYKVNPLSNEELYRLAVRRLGSHFSPDNSVLTVEQVKKLLEELAISKVEVEIQNEYLQDACARLDVALSEANDLYDFSPLGCFSIDPTGNITKLNLTGASLLGQERHQLIGCRFDSFFLPVQQPRIQALMRQVSASGEDLQSELSLVVRSDLVRHVQLFMSPLSGGRGYQMLLTNITTKKAQQEDTHANDARWIAALDAACEGVWEWDLRTHTLNYSPKLAALYGKFTVQCDTNLDALRGLVHPDDWGALLIAVQKCLSGQQAGFCNAHRRRSEGGRWKWVQCQGAVFSQDESGKVARMVGIQTDISDGKQMEAELLEMSSIQHAVFDSFPDYLAVLDGECRVMKTNAMWNAYALAHGYAYRNGFTGSLYADLLDAVTGGLDSVKQAVLTGIADVIDGKVPRFQLEYSFQTCVELRWFVMNVISVREGRARAVVSHQDVSSFRRQGVPQLPDQGHVPPPKH